MTPAAREEVSHVALVAASWYLTAELAISSSLLAGTPSHLWLPCGVALGLVTVLGPRSALGVLAAASMFLLVHGASPAVALLISSIASIEALVGALLLRRAGVRHTLDRVRDVAALIAIAAGVSAIPAAVATSALVMTRAWSVSAFVNGPGWWWSHFAADLILTPAILTFSARGVQRSAHSAGWRELLVVDLVLCAVAIGVFDSRLWSHYPIAPRPYDLFPFVVWIGLRWDIRVATLTNAAIAAMALASWMLGVSPFTQLAEAQSFIAIVAMSSLLLGALRSERVLASVRRAASQDAALDAIVTVDSHGTIVEYNPAATSLFGYPAEHAVGKNVVALLVPQRLHAHVMSALARHGGAQDGWTDRRVRYELLRADGEEFPVEVAVSRVRVHDMTWFTAFVRDISREIAAATARRQSRELLEAEVRQRTVAVVEANEQLRRRDDLLRQAEGLARLASFELDLATGQFEWSDEVTRLLARGVGAVPATYEGLLQLIHPDDREHARDAVAEAVTNHRPVDVQVRIIDPAGVIRVRAQVGMNANGVAETITGCCQDVTEQKEAEQSLRASLHEKEVLLREIHHRVKNNLQVISSLLNLQMARLPTPAVRYALSESQSRIRSMALVHQLLYRAGDLAHIDFVQYLDTVVASLFETYGVGMRGITKSVTGDFVALDIDRAIACGLIATELVTNAIKHAFPEADGGCIWVTVARTDEHLTLEVRDDGSGFATDPPGTSTSFGLQIATTLTAQLAGTIALDGQHGTRVTIRFPLHANA